MVRLLVLLGLLGITLAERMPSSQRVNRRVVKHKTEPVVAKNTTSVVAAVAAKKMLRAPAPAPAPAPVTQKDVIAEMKEKMASKVGHYDADFVLDRPTTVPPGHDGQLAPGPKTNIVANQPPPPKAALGAPGAAPAPAAPAPAPVPDTGMTEAALNALVKHNDNETMTDDWGAEYGPKGPSGIHGPYQPMGRSGAAARSGGAAFGVFMTLLLVRL